MSSPAPPVRRRMLLCGIANSALSVESANLKIHHPGDGDGTQRRIYGRIRIDGGDFGMSYPIYDRSEDQSETVAASSESESEGGVDLTLCGLNHFLPYRDSEFIFVDLRENGSSFLKRKIPVIFRFPDSDLKWFLRRELGCYRTTLLTTSADGSATLTISVFALGRSVLVRVRIALLHDCSVSGTVTAIQTEDERKGSLTIFKESQWREVKAGQDITLDRPFVLAPILMEEDQAKEINDAKVKAAAAEETNLTEAELRSRFGGLRFRPSNLSNSLIIELKLKLVGEGGQRSYLLQEEVKFVLTGRHHIGQDYVHQVVAKNNPNPKRSYDNLVNGDVNGDDNGLPKLQVTITSLYDSFTDKPEAGYISDEDAYPIDPKDAYPIDHDELLES